MELAETPIENHTLMWKITSAADDLKESAHLFRDLSCDLELVGLFKSAGLQKLAGTLQKALIVQVIMQICKLADAPKDGKYQNASLLRMNQQRFGVDGEVDSRITEFIEIAESAKLVRDKQFAHIDMGAEMHNLCSPDDMVRAAELACSVVQDLCGNTADAKIEFAKPEAVGQIETLRALLLMNTEPLELTTK